jgi:hypothetical protein
LTRPDASSYSSWFKLPGKMQHQADEFCFHDIMGLQLELAMLSVHRHGVRMLTFTDPRRIADSCSATFTHLAGSLHSANIAKICESQKIVSDRGLRLCFRPTRPARSMRTMAIVRSQNAL